MASTPTLPQGWTSGPTYRNDPTKKDYIYSDGNNRIVVTIKGNTIVNTAAYDSKGNPTYSQQGTGPVTQTSQQIANFVQSQSQSLQTSLGAGTVTPISGPITVGPGAANGDPLSILDVGTNLADINSQFGQLEKSKLKVFLKYPVDAIYYNSKKEETINSPGGGQQQDHLQISKYTYKAPYGKNLFEKGQVSSIIQEGLTRGTPLEDFIGNVLLPIPNNVADSNNVAWGEDNMNNLSAAAANVVLSNLPTSLGVAGGAGLVGAILAALGGGSIAGGAAGAATLGIKGQIYKELLGAVGSSGPAKGLVGTGLASQILNMGGFSVSPESILARGFGIVPNSNLELLFNAPTLREFTFQYRLSPRSSNEAKEVNRIIRFFKEGMAAKKQNATSGAGGQSYFLGTPNVFKLNYRTVNNQNIKGVNRIKVCALTGFSVNYAPDGSWAAYDEGQPVSSIINMSFKELEPIYDSDYNDKVENNRTDLNPVESDEVGY
jgi:hypothetical protein